MDTTNLDSLPSPQDFALFQGAYRRNRLEAGLPPAGVNLRHQGIIRNLCELATYLYLPAPWVHDAQSRDERIWFASMLNTLAIAADCIPELRAGTPTPVEDPAENVLNAMLRQLGVRR